MSVERKILIMNDSRLVLFDLSQERFERQFPLCVPRVAQIERCSQTGLILGWCIDASSFRVHPDTEAIELAKDSLYAPKSWWRELEVDETSKVCLRQGPTLYLKTPDAEHVLFDLRPKLFPLHPTLRFTLNPERTHVFVAFDDNLNRCSIVRIELSTRTQTLLPDCPSIAIDALVATSDGLYAVPSFHTLAVWKLVGKSWVHCDESCSGSWTPEGCAKALLI